MKDRNIKWLQDELPKWIAQDIINKETASRIQDYYGEAEGSSGLRLALVIFGTLGAVLIGSGIILVFAKNWDNFSIPVRTVLSLIPLLLGQLLAGWIVFKGEDSPAWREGTATFLFLAVGASISLIGQTYHIPSDTPQFILAWLLLSLPSIYLLGAAVPAIFYIIGAVVWAGVTRGTGEYTFFYWILLAVTGPFLYQKVKVNRGSNTSLFLVWTLALSLCIALGIILDHPFPGLWIIVYSCYFALLFLLGRLYGRTEKFSWQNPLLVVGAMGSLILATVFSYQGVWDGIGWKHYQQTAYTAVNTVQDYILLGLLVIGTGWLSLKVRKRRDILELAFSALPVLAIMGYLIAAAKGTGIADLIFNAYLLILGILIVLRGLKLHSLSLTNGGMLTLALLIVLRFFDSELNFLAKGVAFILVGLGFLLANFMMVRRQKGGIR